jgi:hypothetical protein
MRTEKEYEITRLLPELLGTPKSGKELRKIRREEKRKIIKQKFGRLKT